MQKPYCAAGYDYATGMKTAVDPITAESSAIFDREIKHISKLSGSQICAIASACVTLVSGIILTLCLVDDCFGDYPTENTNTCTGLCDAEYRISAIVVLAISFIVTCCMCVAACKK